MDLLKNKTLVIDPGSLESGYILFHGLDQLDSGVVGNKMMIRKIRQLPFDLAVIEMILGYESNISAATGETLVVIGEYKEAIRRRHKPCYRVTRNHVRLHHFGRINVKNADVKLKQVLRGKYPPDVLKPLSGHKWACFGLFSYMLENPDFVKYQFVQKVIDYLTDEEKITLDSDEQAALISFRRKERQQKNEDRMVRKAENILRKFAPQKLITV